MEEQNGIELQNRLEIVYKNTSSRTIKKNKYLPFVENWEGADEYPRKEPVKKHKQCMFFDPASRKCCKTITTNGVKEIRNVVVNPEEIACHVNFVLKPN